MKNNTQRKQEHSHVKNLKRQLMTKDFLGLTLHMLSVHIHLLLPFFSHVLCEL